MRFDTFLALVPETQKIQLMYEGFMLIGEQDSLVCTLNENTLSGIVVNVEAENDTLKVWVNENNEKSS